MTALIIFITSASLFSIDGMGQDMSVFEKPYLYIGKYARLEFIVRPEWTLLRDGEDIRSVFWSNPFHFAITAPVYRGFGIGLGNRERYNQNFDVYLENESLNLHVVSKGGIEEVFGTVGYHNTLGEVVVQGSYLFGNSLETWHYTVQNYNLLDSLSYTYNGYIFCGGVYTKYFSCYYETFGSLDMSTPTIDTTIAMSDRIGVGVHAPMFGGLISAGYEYSWWDDQYLYEHVHRLQVGYDRKTFSIGYTYNPWYLERVQEHGLDLSYKVPLPNLGIMRLHLLCAFRETDNVQEFMIAPQIELSIRELFMPRRK
jgi:hypothetical protein